MWVGMGTGEGKVELERSCLDMGENWCNLSEAGPVPRRITPKTAKSLVHLDLHLNFSHIILQSHS